MAGEPTTAGCRAVADRAVPATRDAACLAGAREAGARIVGRTNLHELALGVTGVNQWYGTPVNPLDPTRVPGGSSSGSAVAVATDEADVAYGSDTGWLHPDPRRLLRHGRPEDDLGPHPAGRGLAPGAQLRHRRSHGPHRGRSRHGNAVARAGLQRRRSGRRADLRSSADCPLRRIRPSRRRSTGPCGWPGGTAGNWRSRDGTRPPCRPASSWWSRPGSPTRRWWPRTPRGSVTACAGGWSSEGHSTRTPLRRAWRVQRAWKEALERTFAEVDLLVTPTLSIFPPDLEDGDDLLVSRCTLPVNLAGVPALSLPVPTGGPLPASLQLIGPAHSEERLLAAGSFLEAALAVWPDRPPMLTGRLGVERLTPSRDCHGGTSVR